MAYSLPKTHIPRQPGYNPAPPSRWNNPATRFSGGGGSPANRPGKTYVPGKYRNNPNRKVTPRPGMPPSPGKKYTPRVVPTLPQRVRQAVERAFPVPRPYGGPARAVATVAGRYGEAVAEGKAAWEETSEAAKYIQEVLSTQAWNASPPYSGPNAGLTFLENRTHTGYLTPNWSVPPGWNNYTNAVDQRLLAQNTWLRSTRPLSANEPAGYLDNVMPVNGLVQAGHYLYVNAADMYLLVSASAKNWYASVDIYRNLTTEAMPGFVQLPGQFPLPLGAPTPVGMPRGYPVARTAFAPKPLPRIKRYSEVAIDLPPTERPWVRVPVRVYPTRPRKEGPKGKETKSYGKSGAASAAFWAYEATDDWVDWLEILVAAIPGSPTGMRPLEAIEWLRQNPEKVATADWGEVIAAFAGWFVDEAFGAFVGNVNKKANRSTAVSAQTVDMRTNAPLHYSGGNGSPGQFVTDFLNAFM